MVDRAVLHDGGCSWTKALILAQASLAAYEPIADIPVRARAWGFEGCQTIDEDDTQGYVCWDRECVVVAFRGSTTPRDWLGNMNVRSVERDYGAVHEGFCQAYECASKVLESALQAAGAQDKLVWLTGHSLGGAVSLLAAAELFTEQIPAGLYTFGQPKAVVESAAQTLTERFGDRYRRFVNGGDIVTRIPWGYTSAGRLVHLGQGGDSVPKAASADVESDLTAEEFETLQKALLDDDAVSKGAFFDDSFSDHRLTEYIANIANRC